MGLWNLFKTRRRADKALDNFIFKIENIRRQENGEETLKRKRDKIQNALGTICPLFATKLDMSRRYHRIFIRGTKANAIFRLFRNVLLLESFGIIVYLILSIKYGRDPGVVGTILSLIIHTLLCLMFIFPSIMHYFMLSTHRMISSKIKTLLLVLIVSLAFEGPAMNALNNVHKVSEGVACIQNDVMGASIAVDENIAHKSQMAISVIQSLMKRISTPVNNIKRLAHKVDRSVSRVVRMIQNHWSNLSQITNQCKKMMRGPYLTCLNMFREAYLRCATAETTFGSKYCSKIKKTSKMCEAGRSVVDSVCVFPEKVKGGITEGAIPYYKGYLKKVLFVVKTAYYFQIKAFKHFKGKGQNLLKEIENLETLGLQINSKRLTEKSAIEQMRETVKRTLSSIIETYRAFLDFIRTLIHWAFLPITLFWPFFTTALFIYKYNYREEYKNVYLTSEFDRIDLDCALKGTAKVLPLTKKEKLSYIPRTAWQMTEDERSDFKISLTMTALAMATPIIFMCLDQSIYWILFGIYDMMGKIRIEMPPHYEMKVSGKGYSAELMNALLDTFSPITNGIKERDERWRKCFLEPEPPNYLQYTIMISLFIVCIILCRTKVWMSRQSLALADYFYPHRVRPRALHLYNRILCDRKTLMTILMSKQKAILADDQLEGRELLIRQGIQSRGFIRVTCLKCRKTDMSLADTANTRICVQCGAFYCVDCFSMTKECRACENDMQIVDGIKLYYEALSDDEENLNTLSEESTNLDSVSTTIHS